MARVERYIILEKQKEYSAMRVVAERQIIEEHKQHLAASGRYERVIVTVEDTWPLNS